MLVDKKEMNENNKKFASTELVCAATIELLYDKLNSLPKNSNLRKEFLVIAQNVLKEANTQTEYFHLIQNAEYVGIYGISFWIVMINVILFQMIFYNRNKLLLSFFIFLFIVPFLVGYLLYFNIILGRYSSKHFCAPI